MMRFLVLFALVGSSAWAASPYKRTLNVKSNSYMKDGVYIGGKASEGSSLLGVRRAYSAKAQLERVIIDLGDHDARPAGKQPGYYQVSMDAVNNRVVLDLAQLRFSKISEGQIQALFRKSPFVADAQLTLDPEDKAGTMVLKLRRPMRMEVFQLAKQGKPGRVVIDLKPMPAGAGKVGLQRKAISRAPAKRKARDEAFQ